ncbi:TPA: hypothetical protein DEG21_03830 [Patescibacteria group bacterium]|nr:hypothetical protein [Candidatus Gracilibacteria bacterium]HBY74980.1 hypothetical protein [Candidatus Gracilibacteria bacterium]
MIYVSYIFIFFHSFSSQLTAVINLSFTIKSSSFNISSFIFHSSLCPSCSDTSSNDFFQSSF